MRNDLERFFTPRSIAVIGASQDVQTISGQPLKHLQSHGYRGKLYPVNPRYREVGGLECYPSLTAVPDTPDLALVLVNAARVPDILRECGRKGVPYVVVFSSGFSEIGGAGVALQQELVDIAREFDIGVVGPNCQGMINIADRVYAGFGSIFNSDYEPGAVSMVSQSGGFGYSVMNLSSKEGGLGFRQMITTGNEIGVSTLDFIDYFVRDPDTEVIAAYVEGLRDAQRLLDIGEKAMAAGKPILMWKVGNTEHGQRAAASHTANLGGSMALYRAAFRQTGIIQIEDIQDLVDYGRAFRSARLPAGNRLAIITVSGGAGILMTDDCIAGGMTLAELEPSTLEKLRWVRAVLRIAAQPDRRDGRDLQRYDAHELRAPGGGGRPERRFDRAHQRVASGGSRPRHRARGGGCCGAHEEDDLSLLERARRAGEGSLCAARRRAAAALQVARAMRPSARRGHVLCGSEAAYRRTPRRTGAQARAPRCETGARVREGGPLRVRLETRARRVPESPSRARRWRVR